MNAIEFNKGRLYINSECIDIEKVSWNEHPAFKGVYLKHVIKGNHTGNQFSCHLVKIYPGCEIGLHNHVDTIELHEVIHGTGYCCMDNIELEYNSGVIGFIPANKFHAVRAENEELFILAKFFPALL